MAQLNIEQAGIGYDTAGISNFLNKLNLDVIDDLVSKLHNNIGPLREAVDQVWVGQSANAFKEKLEKESGFKINRTFKISSLKIDDNELLIDFFKYLVDCCDSKKSYNPKVDWVAELLNS